MLAFALSFGFFLYLALVGRALIALCGWQGGVLRTWLLAPAAGLATVVLPILALNQAGLPVSTFAWPLTLGLAALSAGILFWRRPALPLRALAPFVAVALFSLLWTGWPLFRFGFGWLSYVNDDFVNYCLAAERFKDFGFWRVPTMEELGGRDYAQYYWFMHVPGLMRSGSELVLSWVASITGRKALDIFMPVILGLGLIQLFAAAALTLHFGRWRRRALIATALLSASPLFMLGTLYQLIAQVGGLGLLLATTAILTSRLGATRRRILPSVIVLSVIGAALAIYYPEVTPFAVLTAGLFGVIEWVRRRAFPTARLGLVMYAIVGIVLLLRFNLLSYLFTISFQVGSGMRSVDLSLSLFPYFMIPTGLANLFGLMPLSVNFPEPIASLSILLGAVALVTTLILALRESLRPAPIAILLVVQVVLSLRLLSSGNDFGLYKIAMFMQPALAAALATALLRLPRARWTAPLGLVAIAALCAPTALYYTRVSQGDKAGGITEAKLASVLGATAPATPPNTRLLCDISNLVAAKLAASAFRGTDLRFLSRDYYQRIAPIEFARLGNALISLHPHYDDLAGALDFLDARDAANVYSGSVFKTTFRSPKLDFANHDTRDAYLLLSEPLGLFNKFRIAPGAQPVNYFTEFPATAVANHLVFVHSGRGNHYFLGDRNRIGLYQQEADPFTDRQDITGLGRFLLLRVEQPSAEFYLRISASKTFMGRGHTAWTGDARILGETEVPLDFTGNGAVNRIVGPIRPVWRDGAAYIAIDFFETPVQFPYKRTGLQSLYNNNIPLDSRLLVAYGRDISALTAAEVAALSRPARLARFPEDILTARGLEYSGIFEDGWLSPHSEFVLGGSTAVGCVRLRGYVPELPGSPLGRGILKLTADGREIELPAATGTFDWLVPVPAAATTRLALRFTASAALPNGDERPTGAKLELLEVLPSLPANSFNFATPGELRLAANGIDQDGWLARGATIEIPATTSPGELVLQLEYPDWAGAKETVLRAQLSDSAAAVTTALKPGAYSTFRIPLPAAAKSRTLRLEASEDFPLPAPDTRRRAGRLLQLEFAPAPPA